MRASSGSQSAQEPGTQVCARALGGPSGAGGGARKGRAAGARPALRRVREHGCRGRDVRFWTALVVLLGLAVVAAFGWQWIADDPGQVLVRLRGVSIETSVVFALASILLLFALVSIA